jgi:nitrite reductase (cytochrome c-552)
MKKSTLLTIVSILIMVPLLLLAVSIKENKAEQQTINAVPQIKPFESKSAEYEKYYPRQYDSYMKTRKSDEIRDVLKESPAAVVLWAGYGFSKDYNAPRGHYYALEDNINTLRTGGPINAETGPMPTACWTCKSPDVPRLMAEKGENDFFTGKWARFGGDIVNPIGCADCHDN